MQKNIWYHNENKRRKWLPMICSVCGKENPAMLCPECGFDSSRDHGRYPTFGPVGAVPSVSALRAEWARKLRARGILYTEQVDEAAKSHVFGSGYLREQIRTVTFVGTLDDLPRGAWDVSEAGDGSVMAWARPDRKLYDLFICGKTVIRTGVSCENLFSGYTNLEKITFGGILDTSETQNMDSMFEDCPSLTALDLSSFRTAGVQSMRAMFRGCESLTDLKLAEGFVPEDAVTEGMFENCPLRRQSRGTVCGIGGVLRGDAIHYVCYEDHENYAKGSLYRVFGSRYWRRQIKTVTFTDTLKNLPQDAWDVSEAGDGSVMAWVLPNGELYDLYLGAEGSIRCRSCEDLFAGYINAQRITFDEVLDTSAVRDMSDLFRNCSALTTLDLSGFNTSAVRDMTNLFKGCTCLRSLNLSSFDTANVQNMHNMFCGCESLRTLNLSSFRTGNVRDMYDMFCSCKNLTELILGEGFDTSAVVDMGGMFASCHALVSLDLTRFNTSRVQDMCGMFSGCVGLVSLNLTGFDTSAVENMSQMFSGCTALPDLNLSSFNTANVRNMAYMFSDCRSLRVLNLSSFNTANVQDMSSMFKGCEAMRSVNLMSFNTANVQDMSNMFSCCKTLRSLNLIRFDTSNVRDMAYMFYYCRALRSVNLIRFDTSNVQDMRWMFEKCPAGSDWIHLLR